MNHLKVRSVLELVYFNSSVSFQSSTLIDSSNGLLEYFPVSPLVFLPLNLNGLIPAPLVVDEFLVFGFAGIKLGEFVAFIIGRDIKGR